MSLGGYMIP